MDGQETTLATIDVMVRSTRQWAQGDSFQFPPRPGRLGGMEVGCRPEGPAGSIEDQLGLVGVAPRVGCPTRMPISLYSLSFDTFTSSSLTKEREWMNGYTTSTVRNIGKWLAWVDTRGMRHSSRVPFASCCGDRRNEQAQLWLGCTSAIGCSALDSGHRFYDLRCICLFAVVYDAVPRQRNL